MWCYQKPGFESLLISELQRQQQCSQFCDTMLKADGVSVPAHSCVLSAISPHVSSALSSASVPSAGQSRLLEFQALGACTLLHIVKLLYSGEMAGEGEEEKQEAISAAAKLGIHGLVEVTRRDGGSGRGKQVEKESQTEPAMQEDNEGKMARWRREVRNGDTMLWKETLCTGRKDAWTQAVEPQVNTAPTAESAASAETNHMSVLQVVEEREDQIVSQLIPHIPSSLLRGATPYGPVDPMQDFTGGAQIPGGSDATTQITSVAPPPSPYSTACIAPQAAASESTEAEAWQEEQLKQFQGNIPGFINHFFNPDRDRGSQRGRRQGRPRRRTGHPSRAGTGGGRMGGPRGSRAGRGRGKLTETVDVQHVKASKVQKQYLHRWGRRSISPGQGGGAAGRKLFLKSRQLLRSGAGHRNGWRCDKAWELILRKGEQRTPIQHFKQGRLPGSGTPTSRAKSTTSYSSSPAPGHISSSPHLQPSPSSQYMSPATSLLHTTALPPPDLPAREEQPEQIERLLEEVMMGLDILSNANRVPFSQNPGPTDSSCSFVVTNSNQQVSTSASLGGGPGCRGSAAEAYTSMSPEGEVPVLQQQGEGELNDILDSFLQSFDQHIEDSLIRDEEEINGVNGSGPKSSRVSEDEEARTAQCSQPPNASTGNLTLPLCAKGVSRTVRAQEKICEKGTSQHCRSLEKEPARESGVAALPYLRDKQLQQIPVVKLERRGIMLQETCYQLKSSAKRKSKASSPRHCCIDSSKKMGPESLCTEKYPIRSRLRETNKPNVSTSRQLRPRRNGLILSSPLSCSKCGEHEKQVKEEPQEVETTRRRKRRGGSEVEMTSSPTTAKKVNFDRQTQQVLGSCALTLEGVELVSEPLNTPAEEVIDVEMITLNDRGDHLEREEISSSEAEERLMDKEVESSRDEEIILDRDSDTQKDPKNDSDVLGGLEEIGRVESQSEKRDTEGSLGNSDNDDIDVVGGSAPSPEPVIISWTDSSGDEEKEEDEVGDIDVVGDVSSATFTVHGASFRDEPAYGLQRGVVDLQTAAHEVLLLKMTGELFR